MAGEVDFGPFRGRAPRGTRRSKPGSGPPHHPDRPRRRGEQRNGWFEVEQTVGELRIRLGERAKKLKESPPN
jgi:hypothetical protein